MAIRENILAAFATTLGALASGRVYRSRMEQLPALPAIVIEPEAEEAAEQLIGVMDAELQVTVWIFAKGDTPDNAADSLLSSVHSALCADLTLGLGSDVQLLPRRRVSWDFDKYDEARVAVRYSVFYRTTFGGM
jgi:hypothetical protein